MGRKNRKGRTRNMGRGKQIRTTLANDILIQQNTAEETSQNNVSQDSVQMDKAICENIGITAGRMEGLADQTIEVIPLDRMFLETYQRTLQQHKVDKIVKEFDSSKLGVLMVSERPDGRYAVIDGQHRRHPRCILLCRRRCDALPGYDLRFRCFPGFCPVR